MNEQINTGIQTKHNKQTSVNKFLFTFVERFSLEWKLLVTLFVFLSMFFFYLYVEDRSEFLVANGFADIFVKSVFSSLIIAALVILGQRFYERKTAAHFLQVELELFEQRITGRIENLIASRFKYGLKEIVGKIDDGEIISDPRNRRIMWMNTKFNNANQAKESIDQSLSNGTDVSLLLMHQDNPCAEYRARDSCDRPADAARVETTIKSYKSGLSDNQEDMVDFYRVMQEQKKEDPSRGAFALRFYRDLPSVPILIIESGERHEEVYTGFYLNKFSSGMPYIHWESGEEAFIDNLYDYFNRKWNFAEQDDAEKMLECG